MLVRCSRPRSRAPHGRGPRVTESAIDLAVQQHEGDGEQDQRRRLGRQVREVLLDWPAVRENETPRATRPRTRRGRAEIGAGSEDEAPERLAGRATVAPLETELVALGAAAQAAAQLTGEEPVAVAWRWRRARGPLAAAVPRDPATLARISRVRGRAAALLAG